MKKVIQAEYKRESNTLITDITFTHVPAWYGETERPLKLSLLLPKHKENHKKLPLLIWICGGAFRVMDRNVWIPQLNTYAREGFVVASVEYRTSHEAPFPAALQDVKSAIRFLKAHADKYCIDAQHITVMGESAGGTLACLTGVTAGHSEYEQGDWLEYSSQIHQVIDLYGITDMETQLREKGELVRVIEDFLGIDIPKNLRSTSALAYITEQAAMPDFLILHGREDKLVPIVQSERMYEKLTACGKSVDYYILEGAEHGADAFYQDNIESIVINWLRGR